MSLTKSDFEVAKRLIDEASKIVIAVHVRPDPDAIGCALALARVLRRLGKKVTVVSEDGLPDICAYLPDASEIVKSTDERGFDLGIICDADGPDRIGSAADVVVSSSVMFVIDHHATGQISSIPTECLCLTDPTAAATAEIVFELLHELDIFFDQQVARQLMAGLVGDTGGFRFSNVTDRTLEIASRLTALGASPAEAAREIYENKSLVNARLLGIALLAIEIESDGRLVWSRITHEDFTRFGATDTDTDSIVNHLIAIKGAKVAVLFREPAEGMVQVSFRSREGIEVDRIAALFGGGGHAAASGCTIELPLEEAQAAVLAEVRAWMES